jgi:type I protein arginine methyltransferase
MTDYEPEIHETMLKDQVRTDAYRDFIYNNKHLFHDKVVLDVGCGSGILSMFCARAGARKVFAVDNSSIINKAREIIHANKLDDRIVCLHGKIEDVKLPDEEVDIIVSEWMGYCLLYEGMLDSVIWAREKYLKKNTGILVPSHCTIRLAPVTDPEYIAETVDFWRDVYGFNMEAMSEEQYRNVIIRRVEADKMPAKSSRCFLLDMKLVSTDELDFKTDFDIELDKDMESLDGWDIWFDTFFTPPDLGSAVDIDDTTLKKSEHAVAFTTGPHGPSTHWQSGLMLVKQDESKPSSLRKGDRLVGTISFAKGERDPRSLVIQIEWKLSVETRKRKQVWQLQ